MQTFLAIVAAGVVLWLLYENFVKAPRIAKQEAAALETALANLDRVNEELRRDIGAMRSLADKSRLLEYSTTVFAAIQKRYYQASSDGDAAQMEALQPRLDHARGNRDAIISFSSAAFNH